MLRKISLMALGAALILTTLAFVDDASADEADWYHGVGTQTLDYGGEIGVVERSVEAWVAPDGRYRVIVQSLNSPKATEEFVSDGAIEWMLVTPPGQDEAQQAEPSSALGNFAVNGFHALAGKATTLNPLANRTSNGAGLPVTETVVQSNGRTTYDLRMEWTLIDGAEPALAPETGVITRSLLPETLDIRSAVSVASGQDDLVGTESVQSRSKIWLNYVSGTGQYCIKGKNYRDQEDDFLGAYTSGYSGTYGCKHRVGVSLWENSQLAGSGFCQPIGFIANSHGYSYRYIETYSANLSPTCTSHAGWDQWDTLVVNYEGLDTYPWSA